MTESNWSKYLRSRSPLSISTYPINYSNKVSCFGESLEDWHAIESNQRKTETNFTSDNRVSFSIEKRLFDSYERYWSEKSL